VQRLIELAELDQIDAQGNLIPLKELPEADRRVITVAANSLLDRAFGKPKDFDPKADANAAFRLRCSQNREELEKLSDAELDALEAFAKARLEAQQALEDQTTHHRQPSLAAGRLKSPN
jgi:hypothetical protein